MAGYLRGMSIDPDSERPIVFLHLPKTGGQTIHHSVGALFGERNISPYRLQSHVRDGATFPPEYRMHSGHLHWRELENVPGDPFSFMVLRDPRERLGSFFFFMREEARRSRDANGVDSLPPAQRVLLNGASALFFSKDPQIQLAVRERWSNLTLTYLALRSLIRRGTLADAPLTDLLALAEENSRKLTAIYRFGEFEKIEDDIEASFGTRPDIVTRHANPGPLDRSRSRWQALLDELDSDAQRSEMERHVAEDLNVMERITFR
jgi:hypothetical protein